MGYNAKICAAPDCGREYSPTRGGQKYCSTACNHRWQQWRGDKVSYSAMMRRVRNARGPASAKTCRDCKDKPAASWIYTGRDPNEVEGTRQQVAYKPRTPRPDGVVSPERRSTTVTFSLDPGYYIPLCRSCTAKRREARKRAKSAA